MLQCITLGSASNETDSDESQDGINLNVTARVSSIRCSTQVSSKNRIHLLFSRNSAYRQVFI
jgi:hypothetical protein